MYFLNGDRIYIKPEKATESLNGQLQDCLNQLKKINSGKQIFKLNFFVDADSNDGYNQLNSEILSQVAQIYSDKIIVSTIAQPPLTCKIIIEAFYYDPALWNVEYLNDNNSFSVLFSRANTKVLIGKVHSDNKQGCKVDSEDAFNTLSKLFQKLNFPVNSIVRQWNYLENIVGFDGEDQRYQKFNDVRSAFYGSSFEETGYPAATGIGMNSGGLIIEFVAVKSDELETSPVDNPEQIAAHNYSEKVLIGEECILKTTPKFERARYLNLFNKKLVFISGTASITGEKTIGVSDPAKQTEITINNIKRLYSHRALKNISDEKLQSRYGHARVYVKHRKDFSAIKETFESHYGNQPVVYIIADICRDDLLVEIEGKVILE
jgi:hypothetical protein